MNVSFVTEIFAGSFSGVTEHSPLLTVSSEEPSLVRSLCEVFKLDIGTG